MGTGTTAKQPHVVIIGGGFGGLAAARTLRRAPVRVTLVDERNHHLFQPLLYQVATAALAAPDIAAPIRTLLKGHKNATVFRRAVTGIDLGRREVRLGEAAGDDDVLSYDYLVVAAGARNHYYGHDAWAEHAPGLKSIDDAFEIRRRILVAYEEAELCRDPERQRALLTFVVVGAGATGVELAGALAEIARKTMTKQFRHFDPAQARVVLVEGGPRVLASFPEDLSLKATERLRTIGVEVRLETRVASIDDARVVFAPRPGEAAGEVIATRTVLWAAGIAASPLAAMLAPDHLDRGGRVVVTPNLSVPDHPEVFAVGDMAAMPLEPDARATPATPGAARTVPGVAQGALQGGRHAAREILRAMRGETRRPFVYKDKGTLATIGRASAVAELGRVHVTGWFAWILWVVVHIMYLASFRNRLVVLAEWAWAWFSWSRPNRIILEGTTRVRPPPAPPPTTPPA